MNYRALGPFVRSFILLVDSGDICPPQCAPPRGASSPSAYPATGSHLAMARVAWILCPNEVLGPLIHNDVDVCLPEQLFGGG
jgi:hypothetical protein